MVAWLAGVITQDPDILRGMDWGGSPP